MGQGLCDLLPSCLLPLPFRRCQEEFFWSALVLLEKAPRKRNPTAIHALLGALAWRRQPASQERKRRGAICSHSLWHTLTPISLREGLFIFPQNSALSLELSAVWRGPVSFCTSLGLGSIRFSFAWSPQAHNKFVIFPPVYLSTVSLLHRLNYWAFKSRQKVPLSLLYYKWDCFLNFIFGFLIASI